MFVSHWSWKVVANGTNPNITSSSRKESSWNSSATIIIWWKITYSTRPSSSWLSCLSNPTWAVSFPLLAVRFFFLFCLCLLLLLFSNERKISTSTRLDRPKNKNKIPAFLFYNHVPLRQDKRKKVACCVRVPLGKNGHTSLSLRTHTMAITGQLERLFYTTSFPYLLLMQSKLMLLSSSSIVLSFYRNCCCCCCCAFVFVFNFLTASVVGGWVVFYGHLVTWKRNWFHKLYVKE